MGKVILNPFIQEIDHILITIPKSQFVEYHVWYDMKRRCYNKKNKDYKNYGGRGIKVCLSWRLSFDNFIKDMGFRPTDNHTLERMNNELGYSNDNCKWATRSEQARNTRITSIKLLPCT